MTGEEKTAMRKKHSLILENRHTLNVSGVEDVSGFDEQSVVLTTELGELTVRGFGLHINEFSLDTGELNLDGEISSLTYTENKHTEGGFFTRLFR